MRFIVSWLDITSKEWLCVDFLQAPSLPSAQSQLIDKIKKDFPIACTSTTAEGISLKIPDVMNALLIVLEDKNATI